MNTSRFTLFYPVDPDEKWAVLWTDLWTGADMCKFFETREEAEDWIRLAEPN